MQKRNTPTKRRILDLFRNTNSALSISKLENYLQDEMDRNTIYRILNGFCEDQILHKAIAEDGKFHYILNEEPDGEMLNFKYPHLHFKCNQCERVECIDKKIDFELPAGYKFLQMNCWVTGICSRCAYLHSRKV